MPPTNSTEVSEGDSSTHAGANWWKVDLHAHSPSSSDFGADKEGGKSDEKPTFQQWLQAYMDAGIDAIAITDHNTVAGVRRAQEALENMRDAHRQASESSDQHSFRELTLLPGIEITVAGGIHLLGIFERDTDPDVIHRILVNAGYDGDYGESTVAASQSLSAVAKLISEKNGLAIPAHADRTAGLLQQTSTGLSEIEENAPVFAIETIEPTVQFEQVGFRKLIRVLGSDAHHLDGRSCPQGETAKYPGSHFTWVKMDSPSLSGLRNALSDGKSSLLPSDEGEPLVHPSHPRILSIEFGNTWIPLNPWLNTLIGGRGVGKSTSIELMRIVLDRFDELSAGLADQLSWFSPHRNRDEPRAWSSMDPLRLIYLKDAHTYRITWTEEDGPVVEENEENGNWVATPGEVKTRFPVRIYSQKQIFELAKNPQALLRIIDDSPEVDFAGWLASYQRLRDDYRKLLADADDLRIRIDDSPRVEGLAQDLQRKIDAAKTLADSEKVQQLRRTEEVSSKLNKAIAGLTSFSELLTSFHSNLALPEEFNDESLKSFKALSTAILRSRVVVTESIGEIGAADERIKECLAELEKAAEEANLPGRISGLQSSIAEEADDEEADETLASLTKVSAWTDQLNDCQETIKAVKTANEELNELEPKIADKRRQLIQKRKEISDRRSNYIASLQSGSGTLEVRLFSMGNDKDLEANWRSLLKKESSFDRAFSEDGLFKNIPDGRSPRFVDKLETLKEDVINLARGNPPKDFLENRKIDSRLVEHIQSMSRTDLEEIDLWFPADRIEVRYKSDESRPWTPISEGSPGQRTAALLAFVLSVGTEPLVLDQPEDDLENQLIYSLVVRTLRSIKGSRQVIVVTHNANIVVNGNAENVIVLRRQDEETFVETSGALETAAVRKSVCEIMEGGEIAFKRRFERLGIQLPSSIGALNAR